MLSAMETMNSTNVNPLDFSGDEAAR